MELLQLPDIRERLQHCYLLFPTLERLSVTPNARPLRYLLFPLLPIVLFFLNLFLMSVPFSVQIFIARILFYLFSVPSYLIRPCLRIINPNVLPYIVHLCQDGMNRLKHLNVELLQKNKSLIKLYYGKTDGYVPEVYYHQLMERIPDIDAELDVHDIEHVFVIKSDVKMASLVSQWIQNKSIVFRE